MRVQINVKYDDRGDTYRIDNAEKIPEVGDKISIDQEEFEVIDVVVHWEITNNESNGMHKIKPFEAVISTNKLTS